MATALTGPNDASCVFGTIGTFLYILFVYFDTNQCFNSFIASTLIRNKQGTGRWNMATTKTGPNNARHFVWAHWYFSLYIMIHITVNYYN